VTRPVFWSRTALDDLKGAMSHIARENPEAARKVATSIREAGRKLGVHSTGRKGRVDGTFEKSVAGLPYVIAYTIETGAAGGRIIILHVIHTARNWPVGRWPDS
jgi:plasmid stabilization system protein ParE